MSTGSGLFALLSSDCGKFFCQIVSVRVKTRSNTNLQALRNILRENGSLPVYLRRSKKSLLNLPIIHSKVFWFLIVLLPAYLLFHNNAQNWMFSWHHPIKEKKLGVNDVNFLITDYCIVDVIQTQWRGAFAFNTWRTPNSRRKEERYAEYEL